MVESRAAVRSSEYWDWVAVALFLLLTVDMLTTVFATVAVGIEAESNPIVQWALLQGTDALLAVNLAALGLAIPLFYGVQRMVSVAQSPQDRYVAVLADCWLASLIVAGLVLFANNLSVIVLGASLL